MTSKVSAEMDIKSLLECPISLEMCQDPVTVLESGITYDRASLSESLQLVPDREPSTGQRFGHPLQFVANVTLLRIVELVRADPRAPAQQHEHVSASCASAIKALLLCPLSRKSMEDPVIAHESGIVYDRKSLCAALLKQPDLEPVTAQRFDRPLKYTACITSRKLVALVHGEAQLQRHDDSTFPELYRAAWNERVFRTPPVAMRIGVGEPPGAPPRVRAGGTHQVPGPQPAALAVLDPPAALAVPDPPAVPAGPPPVPPTVNETALGALGWLILYCLFYHLRTFVLWLVPSAVPDPPAVLEEQPSASVTFDAIVGRALVLLHVSYAFYHLCKRAFGLFLPAVPGAPAAPAGQPPAGSTVDAMVEKVFGGAVVLLFLSYFFYHLLTFVIGLFVPAS